MRLHFIGDRCHPTKARSPIQLEQDTEGDGSDERVLVTYDMFFAYFKVCGSSYAGTARSYFPLHRALVA